MLPFTKRPGRGESSDVVEKDEIGASSPASLQPASSSRASLRPPKVPTGLGFDDDDSHPADDDDRTGIVQSSVRGASLPPSPLPAAGRPPASIPPPARSHRSPTVRPTQSSSGSPSLRPPPVSIRPPPMSARAAVQDDDEDAEDDDGGRTVVRDPGVKAVRRGGGAKAAAAVQTPSTHPTSIAPAAVIRKQGTASQRGNLMAGPPSELLDEEHDNDEHTQAAMPSMRATRNNVTEEFRSSPRSAYPAPISYEGPPSHRPNAHRDDVAGPASYPQQDFQGPPSPRSYAPPPMSSTPGHFAQPSVPPSNPYAQQQNAMQATQQSLQQPQNNPYSNTMPPPAQSARSMPPPQSMPPGMMPPAASSRPMGQLNGQMNGQPMNGQQMGQTMNPQMQANMPAHFRMAQTGALVTAMGPTDPPGTAVTSHNPLRSGRPAISWAAALAAAGVFVGVVAVAIAQRGDQVADTQASFVDPSHTGKSAAGQPDPNAPPAAPQPAQPGPNALPAGLIGASPVQATQPAPGAVPGMADPSLGLAPPTQVASAPPPQGMTFPAAVATPAPAPAPTQKLGAAHPAPLAQAAPAAPRPPGTHKVVAGTFDEVDDDGTPPPPKPKPVAAAPTPKPSKPAKANDADAETKAALEALQKAQLESSSSFSKP